MENQNDRELRAEKANFVKELISELNEYKKIGEPEELAKMKEHYIYLRRILRLAKCLQ